MKHAIITACDKKYGNFLINHWYKSLKDNVNLFNIDIIILDYGLSKIQIKKLLKKNIILIKCKKNGHITSIRFRDIAKVIENKEYDQIMSIDCADIIFQTDLDELFSKNNKSLRCVIEDHNHSWASTIVDCYTNSIFFKKIDAKKIKKSLKKKNSINAGMIVGPKNKFYKLCVDCYSLLKIKSSYGPDQVAITYLLYRDGFTILDKKFNYVILSNKKKEFYIKEGRFYFNNGELISIVHNAGSKAITRTIKKFGYGKKRNILKKITYNVLKSSKTIVNSISKK
ncbi:glycosyl transferase family 8 [archaeon]|nr:glycosyl transferase family 8 [archaeon]